ncbi:ATP-grasp domain-containing protein [Polynucleobacter sp. MWH-P3-07-1]|uniref:ATP-grasp domain-containing protein n=1 Tax=Polynucleobacter sp. MWH-P3-07-1 TaxID=1743173 RepID=UPI001BFDAD30|nr:ATP-grasp domain-containing protein [Polynucleobacter sp. MWH-P3-07-1]QWD83804.1 ATP-grasp domain-containing protein [Polynucleobacter sp. MWH-P3-07-1]
MKKILLVGTSFSAAPLAQFIKSLGYELEVCGNKPSDPCVSWAGKYHCLDYSNAEFLLDLVERESYCAILPTCNDDSYLSVIKVAETLGLPGLDDLATTLKLHDKFEFRGFAATHGIPVPKIWTSDPGGVIPRPANYPVLVKPVDSFSGKGITKVSNLNELSMAIDNAKLNSRTNNYVVEDFLDGTLHSHSAFLKNQKIYHDFFVDEFCTIYPYQVNCSNSPSRISLSIQKKMQASVEKLAALLNLSDGLLHTQFIISGGELYLIECMRRCPGDLFYYLISFSTGNSYVGNYLRPFIGEDFDFSKIDESTPWSRHTISLKEDEVIHGYSIDVAAEELRLFQLSESGEHIKKAPFGKIAIFFMRYQSTAQLFESTEKMADKVHFFTNRNIPL